MLVKYVGFNEFVDSKFQSDQCVYVSLRRTVPMSMSVSSAPYMMSKYGMCTLCYSFDVFGVPCTEAQACVLNLQFMPFTIFWLFLSHFVGNTKKKLFWLIRVSRSNESLRIEVNTKLTNSMAYGTRRFNVAFTRALQ